MVAGLVQLSSYGTQDLYLTGTPEITFFKTVFRRYTPFAIENIEIPFDDDVNFNQTSVVTLLKAGDLISKIYLKLTIPSFYVERDVESATYIADKATAYSNLNTAYSDYFKTWKFILLNMEAYRQAYTVSLASNVTTALEIKEAVFNVFGNASRNVFEPDPEDENVITLADFSVVLNSYITHDINNINVDVIAYSCDDDDTKATIMNRLMVGYLNTKYVLQDIYNNLKSKKEIYDDYTLTNRKFAWVDRLGHAIVDYIEVAIGGDTIDRHYGDWLNVWYELTCERHLQDTYYKMIGNVDTLTTYDRTTKPSYTLYIPLQFWFCRNYGLAIPLVAMQFMDVTITLKLKKFSECSYIELIDDETSYALDDAYDNGGYTIEGSVMVDYVFLDLMERKKFATSSHEYLIDQIQMFSEESITTADYQFDTSFNEPCKELIWVLQKVAYVTNTNGDTQCRWDNYTYSTSNEGISLTTAKIELNGQTIIDSFGGSLYNYLVPYRVHKTTPSDGIYCYSFALDPEEQQPSGTCNLSRIKKSNLIVVINDSMLTSGGTNFRVYARNYNILRFISGMGGLAFV